MLTRTFGSRHPISVRHDRFGMHRPGALTIDDGRADTVSYVYSCPSPMSLIAERVDVEATRDLWAFVFDLPRETRETQLRLHLQFPLGSAR